MIKGLSVSYNSVIYNDDWNTRSDWRSPKDIFYIEVVDGALYVGINLTPIRRYYNYIIFSGRFVDSQILLF